MIIWPLLDKTFALFVGFNFRPRVQNACPEIQRLLDCFVKTEIQDRHLELYPQDLRLASLCYQPGFLASLINRNWSDARQEIQARLYWGLCCSRREQEQVTVSLPGSPRGGGAVSWLIIWGERRLWSKGWAGGVTKVVCPPPWWCCVGFWSFCILLFIICPDCTCMQLFLVPHHTLYSVARG